MTCEIEYKNFIPDDGLNARARQMIRNIKSLAAHGSYIAASLEQIGAEFAADVKILVSNRWFSAQAQAANCRDALLTLESELANQLLAHKI